MNGLNKQEFILKVTDNRGELLRLARSMVRRSDSEDAVQSAILSAWEHLPQLRDESAFDAWLRQILINRCRQIQRGYKREKDICAALPQSGWEADAPAAALREAMEELHDEERKLIRMHHEQGYSLKEIAAETGKSEDVLKMRLYRARKHLRMILIMLLLILMAAVAVGTGMIDVSWFLQNRRAMPTTIENPMTPESVSVHYAGSKLEITVSDTVWDKDAMSLTFVYSIAGKDDQALAVHSGNIGVDGVRMDHIWTEEGIVPVLDWADGKPVHVFSLDGWHMGGVYLTGTEDYLPDGLGETLMAELDLDWIRPDRYESLLDADGRLAFEADVTLEDYRSEAVLEEQTMVVRVDAPTPQEWREMYETYNR